MGMIPCGNAERHFAQLPTAQTDSRHYRWCQIHRPRMPLYDHSNDGVCRGSINRAVRGEFSGCSRYERYIPHDFPSEG